ncbi:hypothetical protein E2C01_053295 [Portunus trituberculatus]|uniref:Uncharacterized protein n=1 Tax=Portunus trituberculatus TaxID=210409 RepID=A0A5B7GNU7_PORTR|nr:hypothetical protein [Portunus trituberculatus]
MRGGETGAHPFLRDPSSEKFIKTPRPPLYTIGAECVSVSSLEANSQRRQGNRREESEDNAR